MSYSHGVSIFLMDDLHRVSSIQLALPVQFLRGSLRTSFQLETVDQTCWVRVCAPLSFPVPRIGGCTTPRLQGRPLFRDWCLAGTLMLHVVRNCFQGRRYGGNVMNTIGCDVVLDLTARRYFSKASRVCHERMKLRLENFCRLGFPSIEVARRCSRSWYKHNGTHEPFLLSSPTRMWRMLIVSQHEDTSRFSLVVFLCTHVHFNSLATRTDSPVLCAGALTKQLSVLLLSENMCRTTV